MDAGFQLFNLINEGSIQVYHSRFVTAIPQVPVFVLMKLKMPLWLLGTAFSASYILFFATIYHLLVKYLKNEFLGWALIFLFTLISLDTFYHMQSEFYLGLAFLLLAFGIVLHSPEIKWKWIILIPILITVGFSHKLSLLIFLFLWCFFWLRNKEIRNRDYIILLVVFIVIASIKSVYFTNWYEAAKQAEFQNNLTTYFPNFHSLPSNRVFLDRCFHHYYLLPIFLFGITVFYIHKKIWLRLLLVWLSVLGFALLYNISDPTAKTRFYSEVTYLPLSLFVSIPFLFDLIPYLIKKTKWVPAIFVGLIILRLSTIALNSQTFDNNFEWIKSQLNNSEKMRTNRFLIKKEMVPIDTVLMEWGVPFTAMHLSALNNPKNAKTLLIMPDFEWYEDKLEEDNLFFSPFHKVFKNSELNNTYYDLESGLYKELGF